MDKRDKKIEELEKQVKKLTSICNAQEDEIALLNDEINALKKGKTLKYI